MPYMTLLHYHIRSEILLRSALITVFYLSIVASVIAQCPVKPISFTALFDDPAMDFLLISHDVSYQVCGLISNELYEVSTAQSSLLDSIELRVYDRENQLLSLNQEKGGSTSGQVMTTFRAPDTRCITVQIDLPDDCNNTLDIPMPFVLRRPAVRSPLTATPNLDAEILAQQLFANSCMEITNASMSSRNSQAIGRFDNAGHIYQMNEGVLLTTGDVDVALGPNPPGNQGRGSGLNRSVDPDLLQLGVAFYDEAILEFDFISSGEDLALSYVYASDEYCVNRASLTNDPVLILLSGPGISGPFSKGAINLATLSDGTPINVNNLNNLLNNDFYISNTLASEIDFRSCQTEPGRYLDETGFDGFTTVFTARSSIIPCETYHLKIVIADQRDASSDSGIFLSDRSMIAQVNPYTITYVNDQEANIIQESCSQDPYLLIPDIDPATLGVSQFEISVSARSTATEGVDFMIDQKVIDLLPGSNDYRIPISIIRDAEMEIPELIVLELSFPCRCGDVDILETAVFIIVDDDDMQNCDDGDCTNGIETWDGCACQPGVVPADPGCDDGDCANGVETWDGCACQPGIASVDPGCDDGDCTNGLEIWDGCVCQPGVAAVDPGCDDGDCTNGLETWDGCSCQSGVAAVDPGCDDGDCTNGLETWDGCSCQPGVAAVDPGCDDGDCTNGLETWDGCSCQPGVAAIDPGCDDGDCTNGLETWDGCACQPSIAAVDPGCDDGDCTNGLETWDGCTCQTGAAPADPSCDDGDCTNGIETWDGCECIVKELVKACTDSNADNYDPDAECDDGSCTYSRTNSSFYIPNAFSPNGDGTNDNFGIFGSDIEKLNYRIYDRWGNKVYENRTLDNSWDGTFNRQPAEQGVYLVRYELMLKDASKKIGQQSINLLR